MNKQISAYIFPPNVKLGPDYRYPYVRRLDTSVEMSEVPLPGFVPVRPLETQFCCHSQDDYTLHEDTACRDE